MRGARVPGPPSSSSGSGGSRRAPPPRVFLPGEDAGKKHTRTKAIVILGIALPVLACIIGIAAWAVTTDVLRISPRAHDNAFDRFGHQGKTRIDNLQNPSTQDVDIFQLHGISQISFTNMTPSAEDESPTKSSQAPTKPPFQKPVKPDKGPKPSDILSKLISDMPDPKKPTNFVVFAPVADTPNNKNPSDGRRFDGKLVVNDEEDLVAEESVYSIESSQEATERRAPINRRRKSSRDRTVKYEDELSQYDKNKKFKNGNPHYFPKGKNKDGNSRSGKRLQLKPNDMTSQQPNEAPDVISNRNSGNFPSRTSPTGQSNNFNLRGNTNPRLQQYDKTMESPQPHQPLVQDGSRISGLQQSPQNLPNSRQITNQGAPQQLSNNGHSPTRGVFPNPPPTQQNSYGQQPFHTNVNSPSPQNKPNQPPSFNSQYQGKNQQLMMSHSSQQNQQPLMNHPPPQNQQYQNQQFQHPQQTTSPPHPVPPPFQNPPSYQPLQKQQKFQSYNPPPQNPPPSYNNNSPQLHHLPDSGGPQYFAPPPQTFHTKVSYDTPKYQGSPSLGSYERVAQEQSKDGHHHHHHHHHHHEPMASNSDPIGDVNFSDVQRTNDADRLGTIGLGIGPSRGITVQIGGGNGGGLSGMLPLGALGIAKGIVSSLLPRPAFGLNSKVFLGVEVGRGGGGLSVLG